MKGWGKSIFSLPFFLLINFGMRPASRGPGLYKAKIEEISSREFGLKSLTTCFIPDDSNWNIPSKSPLPIRSKVLLSFGGNWSIFIFCPVELSIKDIVLSIIVRFLRPKKSIFNKPNDSISSIEYCVIICPSLFLCSGTSISKGSDAITTPAAWTPYVLLVPSILNAKSTHFFTLISFKYLSLNSGLGDFLSIISFSL